jgi:hypothetical protein
MKHQLYWENFNKVGSTIRTHYILIVLSSAFVLIIQQSFSPGLSLSLPVVLLILHDPKLLFQFCDSAHLLLTLLPVSKDIPQTSGRFLVTVVYKKKTRVKFFSFLGLVSSWRRRMCTWWQWHIRLWSQNTQCARIRRTGCTEYRSFRFNYCRSGSRLYRVVKGIVR